MSISRATLPFLLLLAAACGSSDPATLKNDGYAAMDAGDSAAALEKFDAALAQLDASAADYVEVAVARCQALAGVDGGKCKTEFLALTKSAGDKLQDKDYSAVVSSLVVAKQFDPAIDLMEEGKKRFPESPKMVKLAENVVAAAEKAADPAAMSKLSGLGYLGGE